MAVPCAIIGSGNIGTDLMYKIARSDQLDLVALIGIDEASEGLKRARSLGYEGPHNGIEWVQENPDAVKIVFDATSVDVVANIAGIYPPTTLATYTEETFRRVFDVNVLGVLNVTAACRPYLAAGSAVVNFASVDAFTVSPGQLVYGASKAAVVMLTKELALELAPAGGTGHDGRSRRRHEDPAPWLRPSERRVRQRGEAAAGDGQRGCGQRLRAPGGKLGSTTSRM